jgi:hypothetical protein
MPRATSTTRYIEQPVTHRIENLGDAAIELLEIEVRGR